MRTFILGTAASTLLLGFPFLGSAVAGRVFLMASTPLVAVLAYVAGLRSAPLRRPILVGAGLLTILVGVPILPRLSTPIIPPESVPELKRIGRSVPDIGHSLIVARHGLEWWAAFHLRARSATQDFLLKPGDWRSYPRIYFLRQTGGADSELRRHEVRFPPSAKVVFSGTYYQLALVDEPPEGTAPPPAPGQDSR